MTQTELGYSWLESAEREQGLVALTITNTVQHSSCSSLLSIRWVCAIYQYIILVIKDYALF